jgi:hypothetical protein
MPACVDRLERMREADEFDTMLARLQQLLGPHPEHWNLERVAFEVRRFSERQTDQPERAAAIERRLRRKVEDALDCRLPSLHEDAS